jgi:hypothetical protein
MLEAGCQAVASVPALACDGSVLAMISVHRRRPMAWNDQQKQELETVAASLGRLLSV